MDNCALCKQSVGPYPVNIKHDGKEYPCCCGSHADILWGHISLRDMAKMGSPGILDKQLHLRLVPPRTG